MDDPLNDFYSLSREQLAVAVATLRAASLFCHKDEYLLLDLAERLAKKLDIAS